MSSASRSPRFDPIVTRKATDLIADQIRQRIFSNEFTPGEMLPSEAELVRQTASSSASVRGALRTLEAQGLIEMRAGRSGGAIVRIPGEDQLAATVTQLIRGHAIGLDDLLEMQRAIEPVCAELAATHRTPEDIADLQAALEQVMHSMNDSADVLAAHGEWHMTVARASHNELLSGLMVALVRWISVAVQQTDTVVASIATTPYEVITSAILRGEAALAKDTMREHAEARATALSAKGRASRQLKRDASRPDHP